MSSSHANSSAQPLQQAIADIFTIGQRHPIAVEASVRLVACPILLWLFYPRKSDPGAPTGLWTGNMSLVLVGAGTLFFCVMAYYLTSSKETEDVLDDPKEFEKRKQRYRGKREAFRNDPQAMEELREWKLQNNDFEYRQLGAGFVPAGLVKRTGGDKPSDYALGAMPYAKTDTFFSEFALHNKPSMILSESEDSYIIGNLASYDRRQYPNWYDKRFDPGNNTPEGQGFGHTLVISKRRIFNVVDPDATAEDCKPLKEMKAHFIRFWENEQGNKKLIRRTQSGFDDQNAKLQLKQSTVETFQKLLPILTKDFEELAKDFVKLKPGDFRFAFHAWKDNSVGHLHMHVFPKKESLRKFSAKRHDEKTIPLEAILEVEEEYKEAAEGTSHGH